MNESTNGAAASRAFDSAAARLNEQIVTSLRGTLNAALAAAGLDYRPRAHGDEIARQIRAQAAKRRPVLPTQDDLADIACAVLDALGYPYNPAAVRAETARQWRMNGG